MLLPGLYHPHGYQGAQFCIRIPPSNLDLQGRAPTGLLHALSPMHSFALANAVLFWAFLWNIAAGGFSGFAQYIHSSLPTVPSLWIPSSTICYDRSGNLDFTYRNSRGTSSISWVPSRMLNAVSKERAPLSIRFLYPIPLATSLFPAPSPSAPTHNPWLLWGHVGWVPQLLGAIFPSLHQQDRPSPARLCCD